MEKRPTYEKADIDDYFLQLVYFLADGDFGKYEAIAEGDYETATAFFYMRKVEKLNEILGVL